MDDQTVAGNMERKRARRWKLSELKTLYRMAVLNNAADVARVLNRSENAIRKKASRMKIRFSIE